MSPALICCTELRDNEIGKYRHIQADQCSHQQTSCTCIFGMEWQGNVVGNTQQITRAVKLTLYHLTWPLACSSAAPPICRESTTKRSSPFCIAKTIPVPAWQKRNNKYHQENYVRFSSQPFEISILYRKFKLPNGSRLTKKSASAHFFSLLENFIRSSQQALLRSKPIQNSSQSDFRN